MEDIGIRRGQGSVETQRRTCIGGSSPDRSAFSIGFIGAEVGPELFAHFFVSLLLPDRPHWYYFVSGCLCRDRPLTCALVFGSS